MLPQYRIAETPTEVYAFLQPDEALESGDGRYVSLDKARGTNDIATDLANRIIAQEMNLSASSPSFARLLIAGQQGCGKSTELNKVKSQLEGKGFACVSFDAAKQFDLNQSVGWWTVLLEMMWQMESQLSEPPYQIHVPEAMREQATEWLARVVTKKTERKDIEASLNAEFGLDAGLPFFLKIKTMLKGLVKTGSSSLREIEIEAERRPEVLQTAVKDIIDAVNKALREKGKRSLVLIVDGLEKIPLRPLAERLTTHDALFINGAHRLTSPPCHLVYSLPLALLSNRTVHQVYSVKPLLMPAILVRSRDGKEVNDNLAVLREVVYRRVRKDILDDGVVDTLALASGGHMRDFLILLREAASSFGARITRADADQAVADLIVLYDYLIEQSLIEPLDYVDQNGTLPGGPEDVNLIARLLVLEYRNAPKWNALHPCAKRAPKYLKAPRVPKQPATSPGSAAGPTTP